MASLPVIATPRLLLRPWRDEDLAPYAAMNADPRVMEYFAKCWTWGESAAAVARLRAHFDRHGRAATDYGFRRLGLNEIVAFTVPGNARSRAVMGRLGMTRDPAEDFDHSSFPEGHPLRRHVLYRIRQSQ